MNISIAIADADRSYLDKIVEVLQEYEDLTVSGYTNAELLQSSLETKRYDILLFDPDISENKMSFSNIKLAICLYSEEAGNAAMYADYEKVHKYQRISMIYKEVLKAYADKAGYVADFNREQNTQMIAVYSPVGGSGKTTVALALAGRMANAGKKVLFLSMEELDSSSYCNPHTEETDGITSLLEAIGENANIELKLKGIMKNGLNGMSYVEGFSRIVDFNIVSKEEAGELLEKVRKYAGAEVIVIDMESRMDSIGEVIFEKADHIIVIERAGELPTQKLNMFAEQAVVAEHNKKMSKVTNFADGSAKAVNKLQLPLAGTVFNYGNQPLINIIQSIITKCDIHIAAM